MIRFSVCVLLGLVFSLAAGAQDAKTLYQEGKALYEAKDYAAALPKLKAAARQGHKKAQYRLARCYDKGHGVEEDNREAVKWYGRSAAQGYAKAQFQMARATLKGKGGLTASEKKAREWLRKALSNEKDGQELKAKLQKKAGEGDEESQNLLRLLGLNDT